MNSGATERTHRILVLEPVAGAGPERLREAGFEVEQCEGLKDALERGLLALEGGKEGHD